MLGLCLVALLFAILVLVDVEVSQLVRVLGSGDHTQPIAKLVLLQELLGQILEISVIVVVVSFVVENN